MPAECFHFLSEHINRICQLREGIQHFERYSEECRNSLPKPEVNIDEVFFLRDEQINFPVATKEKLVKDSDGEWTLELYVFSPRPLDDLLIEPNMPKLSLFVKAKKRALLINDKPYTAVSHDGRNEIIYKELPLLQGWNKLVIKIGAGDRNDFTGYFKCDNKKDFLPLLKAAFVNPETK